MNFVGVDLHKHSISVCVMVQDSAGRRVASRQRFACEDEERIAQWFPTQQPFRVVVEATAADEWFARLVEPLAERFVLAHPQKLRVIAESAKKTDKLDAQTLAAGANRLAGGPDHGPLAGLYQKLQRRAGAKKAIVAVARPLWCVMIAMLHSGQAYRLTAPV